jgi:hypothetical protein
MWRVAVAGPGVAGALHRAMTALLVAHVGFWLLQFAVWHLAGVYLAPTEWLSDNETRHATYAYSLGYHGSIERCTGAFTEPAVYSSFVYLAVCARVARLRRLGLLDWIAILTVLGSASLGGAMLMAVAVAIAATSVASRRGMAAGLAGACAMAVVVAVLQTTTYFTGRLEAIDADSSAGSRFVNGWEYLAHAGTTEWVIGRGIGAYAPWLARGSGLLDLVLYTGAAGTACVLGAVATLFVHRRAGWRPLLMWTASLAAAPLSTNPFWWMWTAMLVTSSEAE